MKKVFAVIAVGAIMLFASDSIAGRVAVTDVVKTEQDNTGSKVDSVADHDYYNDLEELVVTGQRVVRKGNVVLLYPTKRDKRFANGGIGVLDNMAIPDIVVSPIDNSVQVDGAAVSMFVDFIPAGKQEVANIRPQDIERIDVVRNPKDPRFQGAQVVVNYIMKKYQYGGYTKLDAAQTFIYNTGNYNIYSKFSHGHMTYDVSAGDKYESTKHSGYKSEDTYRFDNTEVKAESHTEGADIFSNIPYVTGRVIYSGSKAFISNKLGFRLTSVSQDNVNGWKRYSTDLDDILYFDNKVSNLSRNYEWSGNYYFPLAKGYSLACDGSVTWDENMEKTSYTANGVDNYMNDITERAFYGYGALTGSKQFGNQSISVGLAGGFSSNRLDYLGTSDSKVDYSQSFFNARVQGNFQAGSFFISPSVRLSAAWEKLNGRTYRKFVPHSFIYGQCGFPGKQSLNFNLEYAIFAAPASDRSPVLMLNDEISGVMGNENLKDWDYARIRLGYNKTFADWLSISFSAEYQLQNNPVVSDFEPTRINGRDIMLRTFVNDGFYDCTRFRLNMTGRYFDSRLVLQTGMTLSHQRKTGLSSYSLWAPSIWAKGVFYAGNFLFSVYYQSDSQASSPGSIIYKSPYYYSCSAAYAINDLYVELALTDIFNTRYRSDIMTFDSPNYSYYKTNYDNTYHQYVKLSVTWSIGYGKKVDRRDETGSISGGSSIILQ